MGFVKPFLTRRERYAVPRRRLFLFVVVITALTTSIHITGNLRQRNDNQEPIKQIAYLRTPKTGSSTMACIFRRFALNQNLTVYSPKIVMVDQEKQQKLLAENKQFDIFSSHTIYNHFFFTHIVPRPTIIGLVREPLQRTISSYFYFKYKIQNGIEEIDYALLDSYIKDIEDNKKDLNTQSIYFGIARSMSEEGYRTNEYLNRLNKEFSLVLVLERFNESLVLMKRLLKWSFFDILYGKRKVNSYDIAYLNESQYAVLRKASQKDIEVYNFFYQELEKKVQAAGDDFIEEVKFFEYVLDMAGAFCNSDPFPHSKYVFNISKWEGSFSVTAEDCNAIFVNDVWLFKSRFDER